MKLREIYSNIQEEYQPIAGDLLPQIIKQYSDKIELFKNNIKIYRGMKSSDSKVIIADGSNMNRRAANTSNYVNILSSHLPSWKGWPARNKSFICSTSRSYAQGYGSLFYAIPLDNQVIGVSDYFDFWESLPNDKSIGGDVADFNRILVRVVERSVSHDMDQNDPNDIIAKLDILKEKIKDADQNELSSRFALQDWYNRPMVEFLTGLQNANSALDFLNNILDPSDNNKLVDDFTKIPSTHNNNEVWMSGKVMFIEKEYADNVILGASS